MKQQVKAQVGDRMILQRYKADMPEETKVIRTTKTMIWVEGYSNGLKVDSYSDLYSCQALGAFNKYHCDTVYPYSQEKWNQLVGEAKEEKKHQRVEEQEENRRREQAEQTKKDELEEVKGACLGRNLPIDHEASRNNLPDGSRLYILNLPVKVCYQERKKGYKILIVRCYKNECSWNEGADTVAASYTYCSEQTQSFPSCSSIYGATDEEVLWECCRQVYHSGW